MGAVTETAIKLVRKQITDRGTVVWYDPDKLYEDAVRSLSPASLGVAVVHCYEPQQGFLQLRRQLEVLWKSPAPPRLLIYAPLSQEEAGHALIEFELGGVVMAPGRQPPERDTALATIARMALEAVFPAATLEDIVAQVEAGQLSLEALDRLAEKGVAVQTGVIADIFSTGISSEIVLHFMAETALDAQIEDRQATPNLSVLLSSTLGVTLPAELTIQALRAQAVRLLLVTELVEALGETVPQQLSTVPLAESHVARQTAVDVARSWRGSRKYVGAYVEWADRIQDEIGLGLIALDDSVLAQTETFASTEIRLQAEVESGLGQEPSWPLLETAEAKRSGFWASQRPDIKTRWEVICDAGELLVNASSVEQVLKGKSWSAIDLLNNYVSGDHPWCALDTAQRHLERDFSNFELDPQQHEALIQLVMNARQRYASVANTLADSFVHAYAEAQFELPKVLLQSEVFADKVAPLVCDQSVAYILVDALRYEMACELQSLLEEEWHAELVPALATPPTVTEMGMAALLPGAEHGLTVSLESGKLAVAVNRRTLRSRQDRLSHLESQLEGTVVVARLDQLAPLSDRQLHKALKDAGMIVVTATEEIDGLCETGPALARRVIDDALSQLRRATKVLFGLGVTTVVITSDHGYLFGERLTSGDVMDAPGGETALLKRRVWVGKGGTSSPNFLRASLADFGIGGELEIAAPWNLSCFKVAGGSMEYFHGGLSLPELVIPVLTVHRGAAGVAETQARISWTLTLGSPTITTRFLSVTIDAHSEELLPIEPPLIRVEVRAGDLTISTPVSASYGFQENSKDVQLTAEPDDPRTILSTTVTLMITDIPDAAEVVVLLLDSTTGISLKQSEHVPFSIVI